MFVHRHLCLGGTSSWRSLAHVLLPLAVTGCGGGGGQQPSDASSAESRADDAALSGDETAFESDEPPAPPADPCQAGICTPCGESVCLPGFYCDERESACAWLPQCAEQPSCACITSALPGCECDERQGAIYVSCE